MATSPGQAAYEKWCERIQIPSESKTKKLPLQSWSKLGAHTKSVWESVAQAAIKQAKSGDING